MSVNQRVTHLTRKALRIGLALSLLGISQAHARNSERDTAVWGISGGAGLIAAGASAGLGMIGVGAFEVGFGVGCLIWRDPPDTANAGISVDLNQFLAYQFPDIETRDPTIDPDLASAINLAMNDMDRVVALSRAAMAARDRYQGALVLGRADWAQDRAAEFAAFQDQLKTQGHELHLSLDNVIIAYDDFDPSILDTLVTPQLVKDTRDQASTGNFPAVDSEAISAWAVSPEELAFLQDLAASLQDSTIDNSFLNWDPVNGDAVPLRSLLNFAGDTICEQCFVPEPPGMALLGMGLLLSFRLSRKRWATRCSGQSR